MPYGGILCRMYKDTLQNIGLPKNEAIIYEALVRGGELSISRIAEKTGIHRRNVYDSLSRLVERGLVFRVLDSHENIFQAVNPEKLREIIREKSDQLEQVLPDLQKLYGSTSYENEIFIMKGVEGWRNYLSDVLKTKKELLILNAKAKWQNKEFEQLIESFKLKAKREGIGVRALYESSGEQSALYENSRIIPPKYTGSSAVSVYDNKVVIFSTVPNKTENSESETFTVVVNREVADSFRKWFQFMWDSCPNPRVGEIKDKKLV